MPAKVYWSSYFPIKYLNYVYLHRFDEIYRVNLDTWETECLSWPEYKAKPSTTATDAETASH